MIFRDVVRVKESRQPGMSGKVLVMYEAVLECGHSVVTRRRPNKRMACKRCGTMLCEIARAFRRRGEAKS